MSRPTRAGFTLLEVVVAMAILSMALMAIFDLNAGAISSHAYAKKLTVATLLARGKMTDVEQKLYDEGFSVDDQETSGDFGEQGWPSFKWRARVLAPKNQNLSTEKLMSALMGFPLGSLGGSSNGTTPGASGGLGALSSLFGGGTSGTPPAAGASGSPTGSAPGGAGGLASLAGGAGAGLIQTSMSQLSSQLTQSIREVHMVVSWKDGKDTEYLELVTHVVSTGPGSDRNSVNGSTAGSGLTNSSTPGSSANQATKTGTNGTQQVTGSSTSL